MTPSTVARDASRPWPSARDAVGPATGRERWPRLGFGCAAAALVLFLALPLLAMVVRTAQASRGLPAGTWATLWQAMRLSLMTSAFAMAVIVALGTPLAYLLARRRFRGAPLVDTLVDLPIVLPPAVAGIALLMAFGRYGVVGRWLDEVGSHDRVHHRGGGAGPDLRRRAVLRPRHARRASPGSTATWRRPAADLGAPPAAASSAP